EELPAGFVAEHRAAWHEGIAIALTDIAGAKRRLCANAYERPVSPSWRAIALKLHLAGDAHGERVASTRHEAVDAHPVVHVDPAGIWIGVNRPVTHLPV